MSNPSRQSTKFHFRVKCFCIFLLNFNLVRCVVFFFSFSFFWNTGWVWDHIWLCWLLQAASFWSPFAQKSLSSGDQSIDLITHVQLASPTCFTLFVFIQFKPSSTRNGTDKKSSSETLKSPKRCPEGTVLIRRTKKEDLIRAKRYGQRVQAIQPQDTNTEDHVRCI